MQSEEHFFCSRDSLAFLHCLIGDVSKGRCSYMANQVQLKSNLIFICFGVLFFFVLFLFLPGFKLIPFIVSWKFILAQLSIVQ